MVDNMHEMDTKYTQILLVSSEKVSIINEWCFSTLVDKWEVFTYDDSFGAHPPIWYFKNKEDYILFKLTWV